MWEHRIRCDAPEGGNADETMLERLRRAIYVDDELVCTDDRSVQVSVEDRVVYPNSW